MRGHPPNPRGSPPHGGVDRNPDAANQPTDTSGRLLTEAWIETAAAAATRSTPAGRLLTEAWIETVVGAAVPRLMAVASSRRRGSKHGRRPGGRHDPHVASSRRRGSKLLQLGLLDLERGSPPHGGVDRNRDEGWGGPGWPASPPHGGVDRNIDGAPTNVTGARRLLTEAWIETCQRRGWPGACRRRLLTEAWIETCWWATASTALKVASSRRRGSKRFGRVGHDPAGGRLLTEAWIETRRSADARTARAGRLLTEAWIETAAPLTGGGSISVASSRRRGSKQLRVALFGAETGVASSRRRGSKPHNQLRRLTWPRSPPHGGVDRNTFRASRKWLTCGRLLTEAWIETHPASGLAPPPPSPPHGGVDRNKWGERDCCTLAVASSRRRGSKHG